MANNIVEFLFLKTSVEQFIRDLEKFVKAMKGGEFSQDEVLEIMGYFVAVKENIEGLETRYLRL
jgi:hypothetical protein